MEEEIKNVEENQTVTEEKVKQGSNIFLYDGPIGRLRFIILMGSFFLLSFIYFLLVVIAYNLYFTNNLTPLFIGLGTFYLIIYIWFFIMTYAKRLYDIFGEKPKAIFYAILLFISMFAASFIPALKYITIVFGFLVLIILICLPGKLIIKK